MDVLCACWAEEITLASHFEENCWAGDLPRPWKRFSTVSKKRDSSTIRLLLCSVL